METVYCISYDLARPVEYYAGLMRELKRSSGFWHYLNSTWLISTTEDARQIWQRLSQHLEKKDQLLIVEIGHDYGGWLPPEAWDWIKQHVSYDTVH